MSKTLTNTAAWPPTGWTSLGGIKKLQGQSLVKDPDIARVRGLSYKIISDPLHVMGQSYYIHRLSVDAWEYTIQNDSTEFPVLSLKIMDRFDPQIPEEYYVSEIKCMACNVDLNERSVRRALQLSRFLTRQVDKGYVPDTDKALRMYRLHPVQLYVHSEIEKTARGWPFTVDNGIYGTSADKKS